MRQDYSDIRYLIKQPIKWFDENGTPRYCDFHPSKASSFYADEVCLLKIACQNCLHCFEVAISWDEMIEEDVPTISFRIEENTICYGDPPNIGCCEIGLNQSSVAIEVLQYWKFSRGSFPPKGWERVPSLERNIDNGWFDYSDLR